MDSDPPPDPELLKELQASRAIFNESLSADEKIKAYRKQSIILDEITKSTTKSERLTLLRSHLGFHNKLSDSESYHRFLGERGNNVEKLLRNVSRGNSSVELTADQYLKQEQFLAEPSCSGKYHSCVKNEVNADDLRMMKSILGEIPTVEFTGLSASVSVNRPEPSKRVQKLSLHSMLGETRSAQSIPTMPGFRTAREELIIQNTKKNQSNDSISASSSSRALFNYGASKKSLGARRNVRSGFVPPVRQDDNVSPSSTPPNATEASSTEPVDERLQNIDPKMVELISSEIMHKYKPIGWNDIAGLEYAKATIKEAIVWPLLRPDIFTGLRRPPRGVLLFGPPGTGKTLIGKCIASQSKSTFFSISASSLTSKWVGDGEKMVRALFAVAAVHQPSVVFIDEIDSLLSQRSNSEHESSRRLKTEFLVQLDGANTKDDERILIVGATNRPQELDEAARRRLVRRLYIPLPEISARVQILTNLLSTVLNSLKEEDIVEIAKLTDGYSGADMETLCREASMEPIRIIAPDDIPFFKEESVRPVEVDDFHAALLRVRPSVSQGDLKQYEDWNRNYGAGQ